MRFSYAAFESGQKSGSAEVYEHEMPGGQYTNLQFQSTSLGLATEWSQVKKNYAAANKLLGDIVKVTLSSRLVPSPAPLPRPPPPSPSHPHPPFPTGDALVQGGRRPRSVHDHQQVD